MVSQYEEQVADLTEKLERKEHYMQQKEKKWIQIEEIMEEYAQEDEELREKFRELRCGLKADTPITNIVHEAERYRRECTFL